MPNPSMPDLNLDTLHRVADIARRAGAAIMTVYATDFAVETKDDSSPVTQADRLAEDIITAALRAEIGAGIPIVGEEAATQGEIDGAPGPLFWLVDPLDGTKEFVKRSGEFTVNIALISNGEPVLGVVHLPALDETFMAGPMGAYRQQGTGTPVAIASRPAPAAGLTAVVSRSHGAAEADAYLTRFTVAERVDAGSSLKFCRIAEGAADIYPRFGRTMEWDTAAGQAVLIAAGGRVVRTDGTPLTYGKAGLENPHFIAAGKGVDLGA